jgi:hypothetical protein
MSILSFSSCRIHAWSQGAGLFRRAPLSSDSESVCNSSEATLSQWLVARVGFSSHSEFVLCGYVHGHPHLRDGHPAVTSTILEFSEDDSWARTMNTLYRLHETAVSGESDSDWKLRVLLFVRKHLVAPLTLQGIEVHVNWPHIRSSTAKFPRPIAN